MASRTPPAGTRTWNRQQAGSHTCRRSCTSLARIGRMRRWPHSGLLREEIKGKKKKRSGKLWRLPWSIRISQYFLEPKSLLMPVIILSAELNEDGSAIWMNNDLSPRIPPIDYRPIYPTRHAITLSSENKSSSSDRNPLVATRRFRAQVERLANSCVSRILNCNTRLGPEPLDTQGEEVLFG